MPDIPNKDVGRSPDSGYLPNLTPAISPTSANKTFSLTPAERIHLDIYGYVVLERVLSKAEVDLLVETILQFEQDYHTGQSTSQVSYVLYLNHLGFLPD